MFCTTDKALPGAAPRFPGGLVWREALEALSIGIESAVALLATLSLSHGVNRRGRSVLCHIWCYLSRQGRLRLQVFHFRREARGLSLVTRRHIIQGHQLDWQTSNYWKQLGPCPGQARCTLGSFVRQTEMEERRDGDSNGD
jgi:hypothetical protein